MVLHTSSAEWPKTFADEARRIERALAGIEVGVHHTGSTSVPGLRAKPIIDITMTVPDSTDEQAYLPALAEAGYEFVLREPEWFEHRLFKRLAPNVNLHVFTVGSPEVDRMLLFRDHLRTNDRDRELYQSTKAALAAREWSTVQDYADAKSDVVAVILARATCDRDLGSARMID